MVGSGMTKFPFQLSIPCFFYNKSSTHVRSLCGHLENEGGGGETKLGVRHALDAEVKIKSLEAENLATYLPLAS